MIIHETSKSLYILLSSSSFSSSFKIALEIIINSKCIYVHLSLSVQIAVSLKSSLKNLQRSFKIHFVVHCILGQRNKFTEFINK